MNEQEALSRMIAPGTKRDGKWRGGVIQIHVTRACDKACFGCTQGSNLAGKTYFMSPEHFEQAVLSLKGYFGVVGVFGGNPATSPHFAEYCEILKKHVPFEQRGLWCNNPMGKAKLMRGVFNPAVSNLNVHMDSKAFDEFRCGWPESRPFGLGEDSRHSPVHLAMMDVLHKDCPNPECDEGKILQSPFWSDGPKDDCEICGGSGKVYDEGRGWELISNCDINKHWSAMICVFRGQLRAYFCEVAAAQAILHQDDPSWPDLGVPITTNELGTGMVFSGHFKENEPPIQQWWKLPMTAFADQVRYHCHRCGVPLRGYGELAQSKDGVEQTSPIHADIFQPKRMGRRVDVVTSLVQLGTARVNRVIDYMGNAKR